MRCNRRIHLKLAGKYARIELGDSCVYCGEAADTRDHFLPVSVAASLADVLPQPARQKVTFPACRECNSIAGAKIFKTVGAKRRYVQKRIEQKNKRLLRAPVWEPHEIGRLGRTLRTKIMHDQRLVAIVRRRLEWKNSHLFKSASELREQLSGAA